MREAVRELSPDMSRLRDAPPDIVVAVLLTLVTGLIVLNGAITPLRVVLGILFLMFLPGYVFVSSLFPCAKDAKTDESATSRTKHGIDGFERMALSIGASVAINSMVGFLLNFTPWGIRFIPVFLGVSLFTVATAVIATVRRLRTPPAERFSVPFGCWIDRVRTGLFETSTQRDTVLNVVVVASLLIAVSSMVYAVALPHNQASFTQFYVLAGNESDEPVAAQYPQNLTVGESESLYIGIENQENERVTYTVVVLLQDFGNGSTRVQRSERSDRFRITLGPNQTRLLNRSVSPSMYGDHLRLTYLLYKGSLPQNVGTSTAYQTTYLWVNVSGPSASYRPPINPLLGTSRIGSEFQQYKEQRFRQRKPSVGRRLIIT